MQESSTSRPSALKMVAGVVAGLLVGFLLGTALGWSPSDGSGTDNRALAMMCFALQDVDDEFVQDLGQGSFGSASGHDRRMVASLTAATSYAEIAATEGDDDLLTAALDLRQAIQRIQPEVAHDAYAELQVYC